MSSNKRVTRREFLKKTGAIGGMVAFSGIYIPKQSFAQTKEPFKVGFPIPLTGPYGTEAKDQQAGAELAVAEINAKGGVLGRKVNSCSTIN
jgi:branched-chain amino acid transport system substrate-binding protein